jgi:hypothetical protein
MKEAGSASALNGPYRRYNGGDQSTGRAGGTLTADLVRINNPPRHNTGLYECIYRSLA